jgi:hypothetical protein
MVWPQPTRVSPVKLGDTVARRRILANSNTRLAAGQRRKP